MGAPFIPAANRKLVAIPIQPGRERRVMVGQSAAMTYLMIELKRVANSNAKVLVTGESGVGKELVASHIHSVSRRASRPFVAVNCAGLPETLLESELFGHLKGSFTGAHRDKPGKFELAHTGTLFLDEVGEMTLRMQGMLLRVLETGELQKVGADRPTMHVDARVIAATNRNLAELVERGLFREDLYYRLEVIQVHVPPLRERKEDIPLLADHFLARINADTDLNCRFSPDVYGLLQAYSWPGNVRQLENVVQRLVINSSDGLITPADLPTHIRANATTGSSPTVKRRHERRRSVADRLYEDVRAGGSFWELVYKWFIDRWITKSDLRAFVRRGLEDTSGSYRVLTRLLNIPPAEYRRFLGFLRNHECLLPYRDFRQSVPPAATGANELEAEWPAATDARSASEESK